MQPSPESYSNIPRRSLDIEDYLDVVRRHKGWIIGPMFGAIVLAVVGAFLWPNTYVSSATIRVVPPQVPRNFVPSNINTQLSQRVNAMYQTISSRSNLTNIINTYNLYPKERQRKPMEDVVEEMRKNIQIGNVMPLAKSTDKNQSDISAFTLSFRYENRLVAQKVTSDLVSRFMNENTRERTNQSIQTTQFLKDQLDNAKKELETIEGKLTNFRQTFQGRLPEQVQSNQFQLSALEQRIANINNSLARVAQEKMLLESDLRTVKSQRASLAPSPDQVLQRQKSQQLTQVERDIMQLEANLSTLREHYRDNYPDVRRLQAQLNTARKIREKLLEEDEQEKQNEITAGSSVKKNDANFDRETIKLDGTIEKIEAQIKIKDEESEAARQEIANVENQIKLIQSRIEATPLSEQQYAEVIRDHEIAKMKYNDMNLKRSQSAISEELERRQQGENLEVLDPASLPPSPTSPNRPLIIGGGAIAGLIIGLVLAGAREAKDNSLKNLKDVRAYTQLTILGSVPLLEDDLVVRRRKRLTWLAWSTACLVGILIMTGAVFYYYATQV